MNTSTDVADRVLVDVLVDRRSGCYLNARKHRYEVWLFASWRPDGTLLGWCDASVPMAARLVWETRLWTNYFRIPVAAPDARDPQ